MVAPPLTDHALLKINSKISKILVPNFPDFQDFQNFQNFQSLPLCFGKSCPLGRAILEILEISEIRKVRAFPKFPEFPKIPPLCFGKSCPLGRAILEISEFLEISEMLEILDLLEVLEFLELIFRRADCDPSDDRPCATTHIQRQGLSILMPIFRRISIYVYTYKHVSILLRILLPILILTIDHLLNAQANTSINIDVTGL